MNEFSALKKRARAQGIQTSYFDNTGQERFATEETLRVLLAKLESEGDEKKQPRAGWIEPVLVCWEKGKGGNCIAALRLAPGEKRAKLFLESADPLVETKSRRELKWDEVRSTADEVRLRIDVNDLSLGYYKLTARGRGFESTSLIIQAPRKMYSESARQWGGFLPLYAVHSRESWGAGNFSDWSSLADWVASSGGRVIGSLPLLAAFLDQPNCEPSPYSPASRLFWNEFFIDITAIPEFRESVVAQKLARSSVFRRKLNSFRQSEFIHYAEEWALRRRVLEILAQEFFEKSRGRRTELSEYLKRRPEAEEYARFRAACDQAKAPWQKWAGRAGNGSLSKRDYDERTKDFHLYIQWVAQQQIDGVLSRCRERGLKFYLDLPLGVNSEGYDSWRYRNFFAIEASAGAPPDSFFTKGQDWGFAPLHPRRIRELHYRYVIDYLRFQMRHTGLLRVDHVMGLHRLWWVPRGYPASAGAYVHYRADELYAILSVESHLHKTTLVGENLGTVPPEVNKAMDRHGVRRMYVLQYEQPMRGPLQEPESRVVASINTHDMPAFAAHWKGSDIQDRHALGLIPRESLGVEKRNRAQLRRNLVSFLRKQKLIAKSSPALNEVLAGILRFLGKSGAETILINLEDLWLEERPQNVPGTSTERPNWRRKTALSLEEIRSDPQIAAFLELIKGARSRSSGL